MLYFLRLITKCYVLVVYSGSKPLDILPDHIHELLHQAGFRTIFGKDNIVFVGNRRCERPDYDASLRITISRDGIDNADTRARDDEIRDRCIQLCIDLDFPFDALLLEIPVEITVGQLRVSGADAGYPIEIRRLYPRFRSQGMLLRQDANEIDLQQ